MSDDPNGDIGEWTVSRRQALFWLLGAPRLSGPAVRTHFGALDTLEHPDPAGNSLTG